MKSTDEITLDWLHARVVERDECLVWAGSNVGGDYPQASVGGASMGVRRIVWELVHEMPVPAGRRVTAACGTPNCVHPDHMRAFPANQVFNGTKRSMTSRANIARAKRKKSVWPDEVIREVVASAESIDAVAERLGMDRSYVSLLRRNKARVNFSNPYLQLVAA